MTAEIAPMEWRNCPRFPNFDVSEWGDVRRAVAVHGGNIGLRLKGFIDGDGYIRYAMTDRDGAKKSVGAHVLVAEAFISQRPTEKHEVAHNNGSRVCCHYSQLRWATRKENHEDRNIHGTGVGIGQDNRNAKLTDEQVVEMRERYRDIKNKVVKQKISDLAKEYGICHEHLCGVVNGSKWAHVGGPISGSNK